MSDDDRGPSSDPFGSRESEPGERGMTFFGATAWAMLATLGLHYLGSVVASIRHPSTIDITTLVGVQTVVTLLLLFGILRFYAPNLSIRHFLGLRRTHVGFYVVAILLGAIVHVPADGLFDAITKHYPTDPELDRLLEEQLAVSTSRRVALGVAIAAIGPFIEEVFYRGALFRPLRKTASAWSVVVVTSVLFGLAHVEWQRVVPIGLLGLALGLLRISSGSLVPSAIMHGTFNGVSFWAMLRSGSTPTEAQETFPLHVTIAGSLFTFVLLGVAYLMGERSKEALEARSEDES